MVKKSKAFFNFFYVILLLIFYKGKFDSRNFDNYRDAL